MRSYQHRNMFYVTPNNEKQQAFLMSSKAHKILLKQNKREFWTALHRNSVVCSLRWGDDRNNNSWIETRKNKTSLWIDRASKLHLHLDVVVSRGKIKIIDCSQQASHNRKKAVQHEQNILRKESFTDLHCSGTESILIKTFSCTAWHPIDSPDPYLQFC